MSKFRKGRLASAMLCTLLLGGNASAMQKDVSKGISSYKLKDNLSKGQTKDKDLENRKPGDSDNKLLEGVLYVLVGVKLADEGVGFAQAKDYIGNKKLSPLGKLSLCKFAMTKYCETKTIGTMRNLVAESRKNAEGIKKFFDGVINKVSELKDNKNGCVKVRENIFDISLAAAGKQYLNIKEICRDAGLIEGKDPAIPEYLEKYVKAVLGVSVEQCDKILVNVNQNNKYIAFVKDDVCLNLTEGKGKIRFTLCEMRNGWPEGWYGYSLYLDSCYSVTILYMGHILGIKNVGDLYSFYDLIFSRLYLEFNRCGNKADKVFPELFK